MMSTGATAGDFYGSVWDGRYLYYFSSGNNTFFRYDSTGPFTSSSSWTTYTYGTADEFTAGVFDGRYIYFVSWAYPINAANPDLVVRFDTQGSFTDSASWTSVNIQNVGGTNRNYANASANFDGRYLYLNPGYNGYAGQDSDSVVRYDTTLSFTDTTHAWTAFGASAVSANATNLSGGTVYDGQYVYYLGNWSPSGGDGTVLRYDTTLPFGQASSYSAFETLTVDGTGKDKLYAGGAFDGRYMYLVPLDWDASQAPNPQSGNVVRFDTAGSNSSYALKAAKRMVFDWGTDVLGPSFEVSTSNGFFAANSPRLLTSGWHLLAGVYDGSQVSVYVDGTLAATAPASGALVINANAVTLGASGGSNTGMTGGLDEVQLYGSALTAELLQAIAAAGPRGVCK
jgi:hypothetical protein